MKYIEELRLYEQGKSEREIGEMQGVARSAIQSRLKGFRAAGILEGNHKYHNVTVHWDKVDDNSAGLNLETPSAIPHKAATNTRAIQKSIQGLSLNDLQIILGGVIAREQSRRLVEKRGEKKAATFKINEGVLAAMKAFCEAEGISQGQLVEDLLMERIGQSMAV